MNDHCPDCQVQPGDPHHQNCDVARCLVTGMQRLQCRDYDCGDDVWTGLWPGEAECREYGWYVQFDPGRGWVRCDADDQGAEPDLNRLLVEASWNPSTRRWVRDE